MESNNHVRVIMIMMSEGQLATPVVLRPSYTVTAPAVSVIMMTGRTPESRRRLREVYGVCHWCCVRPPYLTQRLEVQVHWHDMKVLLVLVMPSGRLGLLGKFGHTQ